MVVAVTIWVRREVVEELWGRWYAAIGRLVVDGREYLCLLVDAEFRVVGGGGSTGRLSNG